MNYTIRNLLIATVLMVLGIILVTSFIRNERKDLSKGQQLVTVFVAAKDIPEGTPANELVDGNYLDSKKIPRDAAPPQAIGSVDSIKNLVSNTSIFEGEVVSMTAFNRRAGLKPTAQIKGNERLFTLPIEPSSDVAGAIRPGDHVDLTASIRADGGQGLTRTILARNIEIIDTPESLQPEGQKLEESAPSADGDKKLYVIKATDEEAQYILYGLSSADEYGVGMLLRPSSGDTQGSTPPIKSINERVD